MLSSEWFILTLTEMCMESDNSNGDDDNNNKSLWAIFSAPKREIPKNICCKFFDNMRPWYRIRCLGNGRIRGQVLKSSYLAPVVDVIKLFLEEI